MPNPLTQTDTATVLHDEIKAAYRAGAKDMLSEWKEVCECAPLPEHAGIGETSHTYWNDHGERIQEALRLTHSPAPSSDTGKLVEELARLDAQATAPPWGTGGAFEQNYLFGNVQADGRGEHLACISSTSDDGLGGDSFILAEGSESAANAALIVALRNNLPAVLAALSTPSAAPVEAMGPEIRCPNCRIKFQHVHDVDAHLAALNEAEAPRS